jgi:transposase, IS6 family
MNRVEAAHGRVKAQLGPMRVLKQERSISIMIARQAFVQNLLPRHYELAVDESMSRRGELALAI